MTLPDFLWLCLLIALVLALTYDKGRRDERRQWNHRRGGYLR